MKIIYISPNRLGYELLQEFKLSIYPKSYIHTLITLSKYSSIKTYDYALHPCFADIFNKAQNLKYPWSNYHNEDNIILINRLDESIDYIRKVKPDLIITVGWREIITSELLEIPEYGVIGFHPSLLPYGRGAAPIINQIYNGTKKSGLTMFYLDEGVDSGDIIAQEEFNITLEDNALSVYLKVIEAGRKIVRRYAPMVIDGSLQRIKQDNSKSYTFAKLPKDFNRLNLTDSLDEMSRKIRALYHPYNGAYFEKDGKKLIIWNTQLINC